MISGVLFLSPFSGPPFWTSFGSFFGVFLLDAISFSGSVRVWLAR